MGYTEFRRGTQYMGTKPSQFWGTTTHGPIWIRSLPWPLLPFPFPLEGLGRQGKGQAYLASVHPGFLFYFALFQ